jgi:hypothetical protein
VYRCGDQRWDKIRSFVRSRKPKLTSSLPEDDMWVSLTRSVHALCNTTTSFDDEACDHQKEGLCPRVVESDRDVTFLEHFGETGKKNNCEKSYKGYCLL